MFDYSQAIVEHFSNAFEWEDPESQPKKITSEPDNWLRKSGSATQLKKSVLQYLNLQMFTNVTSDSDSDDSKFWIWIHILVTSNSDQHVFKC